MQLIRAQFKNFMTHKNLSVKFLPGINVIRGENEKGKSSILFGISYNWFGAGFLPQVIEETMTWGTKKTSLFTETVFVVKGETYTCQRSAKGAELYKGQLKKPLVTGQKEVSVAVADLFSLPSVQSASKLIIAPQNEIRGIIALGSTAAATFIEELIDMREIDNLIKDLSARLLHNYDAKKQALTEVESITTKIKELPVLRGTDEVDKKLSVLVPRHSELTKRRQDAQTAATEAGYNLRECQSAQKRGNDAANAARNNVDEIKRRLIKQEDTKLITEADIAEAEDLLAASQRYTFYSQDLIPRLNTRPETVWEGNEAAFAAYRQGLADNITAQQKQISEKNATAAALRQQIIRDRTCPTCGTELHDKEATDKLNASLEQKIKALQDDVVALHVEKEATTQDHLVALEAQDYQLAQNQWLARHRTELEEIGLRVDENTVPFALSVAEPPEAPERLVTANDVALLIKKNKEQQSALGQRETDKQALTDLVEKIKKLDAELTLLQGEEISLTVNKGSADRYLQGLEQELGDLNTQKEALDEARTTILTEHTFIKKMCADLNEDLVLKKDQVKEIQKNADLISAVREARINISNLLWQKLLSVTETYFSLFRGKRSTLSISKKGILVDDHLSAPSGSTLDVLGLSLRLAIGKLFADNGFCALDEPSAGCDETRTAAMAAGLISANLEQIIMVTHKDVDEQIGNLILL
jgi:DNA repair exonuclease SbcCD ATPase subunit